MEASLGEALNKLYDGKLALSPSGEPGRAATAASAATEATVSAPSPSGVQELIKSAQDHYNQAQERLKAGDWAGFGDELKKLGADLNSLNSRAGP